MQIIPALMSMYLFFLSLRKGVTHYYISINLSMMLCVKFGPNSIGSEEEDENVDRQTYRLRDDEQQSIRNA